MRARIFSFASLENIHRVNAWVRDLETAFRFAALQPLWGLCLEDGGHGLHVHWSELKCYSSASTYQSGFLNNWNVYFFSFFSIFEDNFEFVKSISVFMPIMFV